MQLNNAKNHTKLEHILGLQLQHENVLELTQDGIVALKEREQKLLEENNKLRYEKRSVMTRNENIESPKKQCHDELINTKQNFNVCKIKWRVKLIIYHDKSGYLRKA